MNTDWQRRKREIRARAEANRLKQPDKDTLSRLICRKLIALDEYTRARVVMSYVDFRDEVRTHHFLTVVLEQGKQLAVPYCAADRLELFLLDSLDELAAGTFGIPEPKTKLRGLAERRVEIGRVDLIVVPGVAFDTRGGRLGHGRGYFDKLLGLVRSNTTLVAPAFECQLFPEIPIEPHDVFMNKIVTEKTIYHGTPKPESTASGS